jgi:phage terminase large subunit GpA-like protein
MRPSAPYQTSAEGLAALTGAIKAGQGIYRPRPILTLSEWADKYAYIPPETSPFPGKFQTSAAEFQRGYMDAITDPANETIVLMLGAQVGKTQSAILNSIGYFSHWEPSSILAVQGSLGEAEKFSKKRLAPMIRDTPQLRRLIAPPRARDSGNTLLSKDFTGGSLVLVGANAPLGLRGLPVRVVLMDEVDGWEASAGTEGDPADLAAKRTTGFWNRKIVMASTPGIKHISRIEAAFNSSDKRFYYVPCPHCGEMQRLEWKYLQWKTERADADARPVVTEWWYVCAQGCVIEERHKHEMIRRGEWRATAKSHDGKTAGFYLNTLYSPFTEWVKLIREWLEAQHSLERMKVFVNTVLAETWEIRGTGANQTELEKRPRFQHSLLPAGVLWLTAGVDTQDDRLECSVWGWGLDDERWAIEHKVFPGDPSLPDTDESSPWAALREYLMEEWEHAAGVTMRISAALVDSGGHHTERVYEFTRKHRLRRWHAIVGRSGIGRPLLGKESHVGQYETTLFTVGVDTAKEDVYTSLRNERQGTGYTYFSDALNAEYFRQLTSEKLVKTTQGFTTSMRWEKTSERNEALDCAVYARAAVAVRRPNFRKLAKSLFRFSEKLRAERAAAGKPILTPADEVVGGQDSAWAEKTAETAVALHEVLSAAIAEKQEPKPVPPPAKVTAAARKRAGIAGQLRGLAGKY